MLKNISGSASLDNVCYLLGETVTYDDIGNAVVTKTETLTFCAESSAYSSEFYRAGQMGLTPSKVLLVDSEGYNGEADARYEDTVYSIYREFTRPDGFTELYLALKRGVSNG